MSNSADHDEPLFIVPASFFTGDERRTFSDIAEFRAWAERQKKYITEIIGPIRSHANYDLLLIPYDNILSATQKLENPEDIKNVKDSIEQSIESVTAGESLTDESALRYIIQTSQLNNEERAGFLAAVFRINLCVDDDPIQLFKHPGTRNGFVSGYVEAYALGLADKSGLTPARVEIDNILSSANDFLRRSEERAEKFEKSVKDLEYRRAEEIQKTDQKLENITSKRHARYLKVRSDFIDERQKIINEYKEFTALHDSVKYWESQSRKSFLFALVGLFAFLFIGGFIVYRLIFNGPALLQELFDVVAKYDFLAQNPLSYIGILTVPTIITLWALKFPARIFKEQLHLSNDAEHRQTVIKTYLSLLRDPANPVSPEEREFALRSIFGVPGSAAVDDPVPIIQEILSGRRAPPG